MSLFFFINWGRKAMRVSPCEKKEISDKITVLPGCAEITCRGKDIIALNLNSPVNRKSSLQGAIDQINRQNGLAILAHPSYLLKPYGRRKLLKLKDYLGMEIYSPNKIPWPETTRRWDFMLSVRPYTKIWGFSSDDMHDLKRDAGRAWIMTKAKDKSHQAILCALREGAFYATTGPLVNNISLSNNRVNLTMPCDYQVKFIGYNRKNLQVSFGREATYHIKPGDVYVRAELKDLKHKKKAWTQPVFVKEGKIAHFTYPEEGSWLRGSVHIHTNIKGGTATREEVIKWYRSHGYDFLAFTEHNRITSL